MSIKIHWGAPGSYKTSGAVTDDFIPAAKSGRLIVTNVRGLDNEQHVRKVLNIPEDSTFKLIYLDTEGGEAAANAEKISRFFHWCPYGAFLLIDEAPKFFPKSWRPKDLKDLDYIEPDGTVGRIGARDADGNERPHNLITAFQQHRHYGWDLVLTSTNITNFRHEIRANAEGAFKHRNMALIGIKGRYNEGFHSAESAGKQSDFLSLRNKKIPKITWDLYASTATGTFSDTLAGNSIFSDPKILGFLCAVFALSIFVITRPKPAVLGGENSKISSSSVSSSVSPVVSDSKASVVSSQKTDIKPASISNNNSNSSDSFKSGSSLNGYKFRIVGSFGKVGEENFLIRADSEKDSFYLKLADFIAFGFTVKPYSSCLVIATSIDKSITFPISCISHKDKPKFNSPDLPFLASK